MPNASPTNAAEFSEVLSDLAKALRTKDGRQVQALLAAIDDPSLQERLQNLAGESAIPSQAASSWVQRIEASWQGLNPRWRKWAVVPAALLLAVLGGTMIPGPGPSEPPPLFPASRVPQYRLGLYKQVSVVPAPGNVVIDGDLGEWNRSGVFRTEVDPSLPGPLTVEGLMMADDTNLYIGAHIGDPAPMKSQITEGSDRVEGWRGGGLQVRLALAEPLLQDPKDDRLVHLDLWFDQERACLHLDRGMDYHEPKYLQAGSGAFQGAFRRDSDERGYVLEYQIPWTTLHKDAKRPASGEERRLCWNVVWADAQGKDFLVKLVEIYNPGRPFDEASGLNTTYTAAENWGWARFR